jgi:hypothetical protein
MCRTYRHNQLSDAFLAFAFGVVFAVEIVLFI